MIDKLAESNEPTVEQVEDITTCIITNGPRGLILNWAIHQDLDSEGWQFLGFSFDLDELYSVMRLMDTDGFLWTSSDKGQTWVKE